MFVARFSFNVRAFSLELDFFPALPGHEYEREGNKNWKCIVRIISDNNWKKMTLQLMTDLLRRYGSYSISDRKMFIGKWRQFTRELVLIGIEHSTWWCIEFLA